MSTRKTIIPEAPEQPQIPEELDAAEISPSHVRDGIGFSEVTLTGAALTNLMADKVSFDQVHLLRVDLSKGRFPNFSVLDAVFEECNLANIQTKETSVRRARFLQSKLTGLTMTGGKLTDVQFTESRLDFASISKGKLRQVVFLDSLLRDIEFDEVEFESAQFINCDLTRASFLMTRFKRSTFHRCNMTDIRGLSNLRGSAMEIDDIVGLSSTFARELGIGVVSNAS